MQPDLQGIREAWMEVSEMASQQSNGGLLRNWL